MPLAPKVGVLLATALSLWGVAQYSSFESSYQQQYRDPYQIVAQSVRFASFGEAVPANAVLGYFTDIDPRSTTADAMFLGAQYILAPRILRKQTRHAWVLGNFTKLGDFAALGRAQGLRLERDFGNGVVLYRGEGR